MYNSCKNYKYLDFEKVNLNAGIYITDFCCKATNSSDSRYYLSSAACCGFSTSMCRNASYDPTYPMQSNCYLNIKTRQVCGASFNLSSKTYCGVRNRHFLTQLYKGNGYIECVCLGSVDSFSFYLGLKPYSSSLSCYGNGEVYLYYETSNSYSDIGLKVDDLDNSYMAVCINCYKTKAYCCKCYPSLTLIRNPFSATSQKSIYLGYYCCYSEDDNPNDWDFCFADTAAKCSTFEYLLCCFSANVFVSYISQSNHCNTNIC